MAQTSAPDRQAEPTSGARSAQNGDAILQDAALLGPQQGSSAAAPAGQEGSLLSRPDVRRMAFVLHFIVRGLSAADGLAIAQLGPWLVPLMQTLFQIQVQPR